MSKAALKTTVASYKCGHCDFDTTTLKALADHMKKHLEDHTKSTKSGLHKQVLQVSKKSSLETEN